MQLHEEQEKFKEIKHKLMLYRHDLEQSRNSACNFSDRALHFSLTQMYDRMIYQYEKFKERPYFAKIVFKPLHCAEKTTAYIGRIGFANLNNDDIIIDWRAPISELYYNSKIGTASFYLDHEQIEGVLELKRQINFSNGEIVSVYDITNSISSDEFLQPYLSASADNRLKNIIATIQKEQDEVIRIPISNNIIVQGVAGSGKTTVALHRLSYLIYNNRKAIRPKNYFIISPNNIFKSYISTLLEELDADETQSMSIENILNLLCKKGYTFLKKHEQYDYLVSHKKNITYLKFKTCESMKTLLDAYMKDFEYNCFKKNLVINNIIIKNSAEMLELYETISAPSLEEKAALWASAVDFVVQNEAPQIFDTLNEMLKNNEITFQQKLNTQHQIEKGVKGKLLKVFNKNMDTVKVYKDFITHLPNPSNDEMICALKKETLANLKNNILSYDDFSAVLYLHAKLFKNECYHAVKHVLMDEAQDYSSLLFIALKQLFRKATFSVFGDIAQCLHPYQSIENWQTLGSILSNCATISLRKSYRTTIEIMAEANNTLKQLQLPPAENVIRHGEPVVTCKNASPAILRKEIELFQQSSYQSLAILCKTSHDLDIVKASLPDLKLQSIDEDNNCSNSSISLLTVQTAKGLEFDAVIIFNRKAYKETELDLKLLYVAQTRALHKLTIL